MAKKVTTMVALEMGIEQLVTRRRQLHQYKTMYEGGMEWAKGQYEVWQMYDEAIRALRQLKVELFPDAQATFVDPENHWRVEDEV
jgi:hypothetical protein